MDTRAWWLSQRNTFGLPNALYAPLPFGVVLALALGIGSAFLALLPGVNVRTVTLSGAGAPWIGLIVLLVFAAAGYALILRHGYSLLQMGIIVAVAIALCLAVTPLALNTLAVEQPDATIGGLGMGWLFSALFLFVSIAFAREGFVLAVYMGLLMGVIIGVLASFMFTFEYILIFVLIYGPIGALMGAIGGIAWPRLRALVGR